ncbi:hypothetical protein CO046_01960 [Candidatus Peregrinibacteria bacterium CG_4_9_14_0_2_um_filter_53_11]|nr:MAG: hypothetical protein CO046_01960 [Candidatus Peregrinibacteria bacterium CG_4_9_14_0_2_um_filter_53_11]
MRRARIAITVTVLILVLAPINAVFAQGILPKPEVGFDCEQLKTDSKIARAIQDHDAFLSYINDNGGAVARDRILACAVRTGRIHLYMIPFFITYLISFLLGLAGLIAVLFVVYGGFRYVVGGITEDKESGKKTLFHALLGLVVALSGWIIVNLIQIALTS